MDRKEELFFVTQELARLGTILNFKNINLSKLDNYIIDNINLLNTPISEEMYDYRVGLASDLEEELLELIEKNQLDHLNSEGALILDDQSLSRGPVKIEDEDSKSLIELLLIAAKSMAVDYKMILKSGEEEHGIPEIIRFILASGLKENIKIEELGQLTIKAGEYCTQILAMKSRILGNELRDIDLEPQSIINLLSSNELKEVNIVIGNNSEEEELLYYDKMAKELPEDSLLISVGSIDERFKNIDFTSIDGMASYQNLGERENTFNLIMLCLMIKEGLGYKDLNSIPVNFHIIMNDELDVQLLLALLYLGIKNIKVNPKLCTIVSENLINLLGAEFSLKIL